jgi:hypothetical protein
MSEQVLLDELVPRVDGEGDWDDVLRRARSTRPRRRLVLVLAFAVAALAAGPAVAVHLLSSAPPKLSKEADRSHGVFVVLQPASGRILIQAAPWKGHDGVCYLIVGKEAGCVPRKSGTTLTTTFSYTTSYPFPKVPRLLALWGLTFDRRVVVAKAYFPNGTVRTIPVHRTGPRLGMTFLGPLPLLLRRAPSSIELYDSNGHTIS